jgi:Na+/H+-dicarboxylate symporter
MAVSSDAAAVPAQIRLPVRLTFASLLAGLALGWALSDSAAADPVRAVAGPVGTLWLRGLQMTIVPLIAALLVAGIVRMVEAAQAGAMARRTLAAFVCVWTGSVAIGALGMPALLAAFPIPGRAAADLVLGELAAQTVPGLGAFFESLVAANVIAAAAETAMLPLVVFFVAFAVAITRLPATHRDTLVRLFEALGQAMLIIIGWVLKIAPVGVFALALGVGLGSRGAAFAALGHYIVLVTVLGLAVLVAAYLIGTVAARRSLPGFARALLPADAVALSTQSSLASLPAMLQSCRTLEVRGTTADFVLPLAVAVFRATGPAMNLGVAIYVAALTGVELTPATIAVGAAVAMLTTIGSVSLPSAVSFVTSVGPIALAMGVPIEPLGILIAVEMLPDLMRTVGNVTMDVAVTAAVDRSATEPPRTK